MWGSSAHAALSRSILNRLAADGGILGQIAAGQWDDELTASAAQDSSDLITAMTEHVRFTRAAVDGSRREGLKPALDELPVVGMFSTALPLNRKERYYTGTVLPMLVGTDGLAHLGRLLSLCGLPDRGAGWLGDRGLLNAVEADLVARPPASNLERRPDAADRAAYRASQRDSAVVVGRYNPDAVICVGPPFGYTRPQWILPYGGWVTVDATSHRVWADYSA